ncbi:16S rRNA (cytidine(1402)-2'-O)-methyltransferase [Pontiella agarivorans]|uniref:Ribosomal RNA small subunit methyltransferase I n=1 Tax=Pontiella agarivorans TaxID=3038953 RepID=A0ABU5MZ24_9BACT|nr:16S rRNA (cytidine(1402)-2'-O)-methyltransferase [Pontiella agarivorans]MDZ8119341.1 16S rRNA (cytidine(1402)-2'-O)-methyltransferase [Pontiella agarivorans]
MESGLYIVGTPIGNLGDISFRALETLKGVDLIVAEDTRHTRRLTDRYEISTHMMSCHKFNENQRSEQIIERIQNGGTVAMVTDSGMPCISDPGSRVILHCREAGIPITAVPGPAAVTTAVALSGFGEKGFIFAGFLPHKSGGRKRDLLKWADADLPVVLYESPYRLIKVLNEIEEHLGAGRTVFVGRELTKKFEECTCGTPQEIRATYEQRTVKGECVVIILPEKH